MEKVTFRKGLYFYIVTSGKKSWYWSIETGEFDGTSWDVESLI